MEAWGAVLARQERLARVEQLVDAGYSPAAIRWRVDRGTWQRPLPKVIATFSGLLSRRQQLTAAALHGGPDAQIAAATALEMHRFRYAAEDRRVHLLIPHRRSLATSTRVRVIRTTRLDARATRDGILVVCSPARAVVDALRSEEDRRIVRAIAAEAVQRELCSVEELSEELSFAPPNGTGVLREILGEVRDGVWSAPEAELRALTAQSPILPVIRWNPRLRTRDGTALPTPDGYLAEAGIALEVDSREFHLSPAGWAATMRHHNRLAEAGILVLHVTPAEIRTQPSAVLAQIEGAYVRRVQSGFVPSVQVS